MVYKKYLKTSFVMFIFTLFLIGSVNFVVDPGKVYIKKLIGELNGSEFGIKLFKSKNGIIQTDWNERQVKTNLAKYAGEFDCVVLGSSHTMQVSSVRNTGNINRQCINLLNLSVSGGSIEDISIFSYLILKNIQLPKKVFIDIDPWTFKFEMDSRYGAYSFYYNKMNTLLEKKSSVESSFYDIKLIKNLFNIDYLYTSIKTVLNNTHKESFIDILNKKILYPDTGFLYGYGDKYEYGYKEALTLIDGSLVYKDSWILANKQKIYKNEVGSGNYKIADEVYDVLAVQYFQKILDMYKKQKIKVNFITTPYHPDVFKNGDSLPAQYIRRVNVLVNELAKKNDIKIYGSYFPNILDCKNTEFLDDMHVTTKCLNKIDFSQ